MDFPLIGTASVAQGVRNVFSTADVDSTGAYLVNSVNSMATPGTWGAANVAILVPKIIARPVTVRMMGIVVGVTGSGNVDVGIYDEAGVRMVSSGSTAIGAAGIQTFNVTDTDLAPGRYYMGMVSSIAATATFGRAALAVQTGRAIGLRQINSVALPLPANATFSQLATSGVPYVFASTRSVL